MGNPGKGSTDEGFSDKINEESRPQLPGKENESESEYEMENEASVLADKIKSRNGENFEKINAETETLVDVRMSLFFGLVGRGSI